VTSAELVATEAAVVPGLDGRVLSRASAGEPWHAAPAEALAPLRSCRARRHPEAGPHYGALRGWGLLVWQPLYLGGIAAHLGDAAPDLDAVSQPLRDGDVDGECLAEVPLRSCLSS
jgi:hypothetical protein